MTQKKNDDNLSEEEKEAKYGEKCPKCGNTWTKTPRMIARDNWWHCTTCNKKAVDLVDDRSNLPSLDDLLEDGWDDFFLDSYSKGSIFFGADPGISQPYKPKSLNYKDMQEAYDEIVSGASRTTRGQPKKTYQEKLQDSIKKRRGVY